MLLQKNLPRGRVFDHFKKGPVKLIKRVKIAHSFLQSLSDILVPHCHFKLAYVIQQMAVKEFFETDF